MGDIKQYQECWAYCEYLMELAGSGVLLNAFDLVRDGFGGQVTRDAYVYERITRPVLATHSREVKGVAKALVADDRLGEIETAARGLGKRIKAGLFSSIKKSLASRTVQDFELRMMDEDASEILMIMVSMYYACHKNRTIQGAWAHPFYFKVFLPFLVKSRKNGFQKMEEWQQALLNRFLSSWPDGGGTPEDLRQFFEHKTTRKIISYAFAGILGFIRDDREKALYLFQVVNDLSSDHLALFQTQISNGLNASLEKEKRVTPKPLKSGETYDPPVVGVLAYEQVMEIISTVVDRHMDTALDWIIQYFQAGEKKRGSFSKRYDKTFLQMNRYLWKEMLVLVDTRKRVVFRTRHLLRIMIYHMFESRDVERSLWQKYIPSVDNVIQYAYKDSPRTLQGLSAILKKQIKGYRSTRKYQDTDWDGFYSDTRCRAIAGQVLKDVRSKAVGDGNMPAVWFSTQVEKGVDYQILYRFFRQTRV